VKAKWVRIALRKVETVPPGGQANTFYDFVGNSPLTLWQSGEDYGTLQTVSMGRHVIEMYGTNLFVRQISRFTYVYQSQSRPALL
jgi:hypothetical protein